MPGSVDNASANINAAFNQGLNVGGITLTNPGDITAASNAANNAAQNAYYSSLAQNGSEQIAINKAAEAWNETYQAAQLSGQFQGKPTESANEFQQTSTGYTASGAPTLERDIAGNNATISLLNILGSLKDPANAFQYSKVLNGTPRGLADIVDSASSRLNIPGFGGGATPVYANQSAAAPAAPPVGAPADGSVGVPASPLPNRTSLSGTPPVPVHAGFGPAPAAAAPVAAPPAPSATNPQISPSGQVNMGQATLDTLVGDVNNPSQAGPPPTAPLPNPNQIDPVAWSRYTPTQKSLLLGDYANQGWEPADVQALQKASLPLYGGPKRGAVAGMFS